MKNPYSFRINMILALSICLVLPNYSESFQFGQNFGQQLKSQYRFKLDQYRDAVRPKLAPSISEDVRIQHKRSGGTGDSVGSGGADGGFLSFQEAPAKLIEAREHGQTTLECSAAGNPVPSLSWYKDGQPLFKIPEVMFYPGYGSNEISGSAQRLEGEEKSLGVAHAKLELDCVTEKDAGFYECVAVQGQKAPQSVTTELHVVSFASGSCIPKTLSMSAPRISQYYQTYLMEMGFDAHLKCLTIGRHTTMWIGPDEETIVEGDKYKIMPDGSLIIHDLTFDDMGVYQCVAQNKFGHDVVETFVYPVAPM